MPARLFEVGEAGAAGAIVSPVAAGDGIVLRTARWFPGHTSVSAPGTVLICTGRSEFIEKYYEVVTELGERGFATVCFDWCGQGVSGRRLRNALKGHILDFNEYGRDLAAVVRQVLEPFCPRPWFVLAHSMSGPVVLRFAAERPDVFSRIVLTAPMIDLAGLRWPNLLRALARTLAFSGFGRAFVPVRRRRALFLSTFDNNVLTSDRRRFDRTAALLRAHPDLAVGLPTVAWAQAAFRCMDALDDAALVERFRTPTLFVLAGDDAVVDNRAAERLAARLRASSVVVVLGARHEILMERDSLRQQFWAAFDAFLGLRGARAGDGSPAVQAPIPASRSG